MIKDLVFFKAGRSAMTQKEQPINNTDFDLKKYDKILVGSPTWAGKPSPHIRTFFNKAENIKGKKAGVFYTASGKPEKANTGDDLRKYLSEIGLEPVNKTIGFQMKKEKIRDGKQNIDSFVETFMKK